MTTFSGKKIFITDADCRVGRVVGKHFKASGCVVHGLRTCREDLDFADESWFADYVVRAWRREKHTATQPPHPPLAVPRDTHPPLSAYTSRREKTLGVARVLLASPPNEGDSFRVSSESSPLLARSPLPRPADA